MKSPQITWQKAGCVLMQQGDAGTFQTKDDPQKNINILGEKIRDS